jgi:hypothetical protein
MGDSSGSGQTAAYAIDNVIYERELLTGVFFARATPPWSGLTNGSLDIFDNDGRYVIQRPVTSNRSHEFHFHKARDGGQQGQDDFGQGHIRWNAVYAAGVGGVEDWPDGLITNYAVRLGCI